MTDLLTIDQLIGTYWQSREPQHRTGRRNGRPVLYQVTGVAPRARGGPDGTDLLVRIINVHAVGQVGHNIHPVVLQSIYERTEPPPLLDEQASDVV